MVANVGERDDRSELLEIIKEYVMIITKLIVDHL